MPTVSKHDDALDQEEARESLLAADNTEGAADLNPGKVRPPPSPSRMSLRPVVSIPRRQSALYKAVEGESRSPRTPNRVRFDIEDESGEEEEGTNHTNGHAGNGHAPRPNGHIRRPSDDGSDGGDAEREESELRRGRVPLLTNVEAPAVTLASDWDEDFNAEDYLETARPKSGLRSAFLNMANSIIGAGIIGQPYAFKQAGLITGIVLLVGLTVTVDWTIRLIIINSKLSGTNSFQGTMQHVFGKSGLIAISVAQWAFAFGGMIAFCIIVGDTIPHVLVALFPSLPDMHFLWLLSDRRAVIVIVTLGVSLPLSMYRDIAKLAKASGLALISMVIIITTIITQGPRAPAESRGEIKGSLFIEPGVLQAVGVISFAFVCHHNSLLIYGSLPCMAVALAGFLTFGNKTQGNVLNNFPRDNLMVNIARLCFGLNMLTTLPLECFVCREVMLNYWFPHEPFNMNLHLIFTSSLVLTAMFMSLITCDLGAVFELVGATSAAALAYILPPLCYIRLSKRSWRTLPAMLCSAFGFVVMIVSLLQAVAKMIRNEGSVQTCG